MLRRTPGARMSCWRADSTTVHSPALRYLVHLEAPGWRNAGAYVSVAAAQIGQRPHRLGDDCDRNWNAHRQGHLWNARISNHRQVEFQGRREDMTVMRDSFAGRSEPFEYEQQPPGTGSSSASTESEPGARRKCPAGT